MRRALVVASLLAFVATGCGGDSNGPPTNGTLVFKTDASTCGRGIVELFIDGSTQGQFVFDPGMARPFSVDAGNHTAGAREIGGTGVMFATSNVDVPPNGSFTYLLICPAR